MSEKEKFGDLLEFTKRLRGVESAIREIVYDFRRDYNWVDLTGQIFCPDKRLESGEYLRGVDVKLKAIIE